VSVVVATYRRPSWLADLHQALSEMQRPPGGFEVVLVDDASGDGTWDVIRRLAEGSALRLRGVRLVANAGQGTARTIGVGQARGAVVAFTDDDCLPSEVWLVALAAPLLRALASGDDGAEGAATSLVVQGRTVAWPGDAGGAGAWARTIWVLRPSWLFETCNIAYRRDDILAVGGFAGRGDAPQGAHGRLVGEDALVGWAVMARGATLVFVPAALVYHRHHRASYWQFVADQRGRAVFPALVGCSPQARSAMWHRWFLARRTALFDLAVLTAAIGSIGRSRAWRWWWLGTVPWLWSAAGEARHRPGRPLAVRLVQLALADAVGGASLVGGSIRRRHLVI
jgi:glycosyltransferase involved in cell wall biosynthesis